MDYATLGPRSLTINGVDTVRHEQETSSDFTRVTTTIELSGPGPAGDPVVGRGEDVTYDTIDHDRLEETGVPDCRGEYTIDTFSSFLEGQDLFPGGAPDREVFRNYRRWAFESAALDLSLRQTGTDLGTAVGRQYDPVRFVASTRLGEPPTFDRVETLLEHTPDLEFKLDPIPAWDESLIERLATTDAVQILDMKGQYSDTPVDVDPDPVLYQRVVDAIPDAILEDPALDDDIAPIVDQPAVRERVSWDAPIHGVADIDALPWEPTWINIKPSRFGSLESLLETIATCNDRGIHLYGGGQFELGVGRTQLQALASLYYPDGPNDLAPGVYNTSTLEPPLPSSPLEPTETVAGFGC